MYVTAGIGEAGKSTFIKQMKVIHGGGYSDEEKMRYKQQIYQNVYVAIHNLTHAMTKLKVSYQSEETKVIIIIPCNTMMYEDVLPWQLSCLHKGKHLTLNPLINLFIVWIDDYLFVLLYSMSTLLIPD